MGVSKRKLAAREREANRRGEVTPNVSARLQEETDDPSFVPMDIESEDEPVYSSVDVQVNEQSVSKVSTHLSFSRAFHQPTHVSDQK